VQWEACQPDTKAWSNHFPVEAKKMPKVHFAAPVQLTFVNNYAIEAAAIVKGESLSHPRLNLGH
jgi:hypothetical protein